MNLGQGWSVQASGRCQTLLGVAALGVTTGSPTDAWAVGSSGAVVATVNGGVRSTTAVPSALSWRWFLPNAVNRCEG